MEKIIQMRDNIAAADKKGKRSLVKEYMKNPEFARFLKYCLDDSLTFSASRVAMATPISGDFYQLLDELNLQGSASKEQKERLAGLGSQSPEHLTVLNCILRKNPDCGFSAKSLHAVLPGAVPYFSYQRCSTADALDRIFADSKFAISEQKMDGLFVRIRIPRSGRPSFETRNGKKLDFEDYFEGLADFDPGILDVEDITAEMFESGIVLEGEGLVMSEDGTYQLPRALSNGIMTKFQGGYGSPEELKRIHFSIWTCLPLSDYEKGHSPLTVDQRRDCVTQLLEYANLKYLHQTETKTIYSKEEAWEHFHEIRSRPVKPGAEQLEGTVVKAPDETWDDGTSLYMAKLKSVRACEVEIYGWEKGKPGGKNEHRLGSFLIRSSCGGLVGKCSGMTDAVRDDDPEKYVGKIAEVHFNDVSKSKDPSKPRSFNHCRFIELREDKNVADSLEYILKVKELK